MKSTYIRAATIMAAITMPYILLATEIDSSEFKKGVVVFSLGYGFPNLDRTHLLHNGTFPPSGNTFSGVGPIHGKFEYGVTDKIGVGLTINFDDFNIVNNKLNEQYKGYSLAFNCRMNFHFPESKRFDPYFGFGIGYEIATPSGDYGTPILDYVLPIPLGLEVTMGLRYYCAKKICIYAEVGVAKSIIQGGLSLRL